MFDTTLVTRSSIAEKVKAYEEAQEKIRQGYALLTEAQATLKAAFTVAGKYDSDFDVLPDRRSYYVEIGKLPEYVEGQTRRKAWRILYHTLDIDKILSIKRADEIGRKLENETLPEITIKNIYEVFETLVQNTNDFANEAVHEVFDWLRPHESGYGSRYKTNEKNAKFEIGKKVILAWCVENKFGGGFRTDYTREKNLMALDRVFHLLDGKSFNDKGYRSPLVDAINTGGATGETDYFRYTCYGNKNLHLEFKRLDLLKEFNAVAGGMNLKPNN